MDSYNTNQAELKLRVENDDAEIRNLNQRLGQLDAAVAAARGQAGPAGQTGPEGQTGQTGQTGPEGPKGPTGKQGPAGPTGKQGPAGPQGYTDPKQAQINENLAVGFAALVASNRIIEEKLRKNPFFNIMGF